MISQRFFGRMGGRPYDWSTGQATVVTAEGGGGSSSTLHLTAKEHSIRRLRTGDRSQDGVGHYLSTYCLEEIEKKNE